MTGRDIGPGPDGGGGVQQQNEVAKEGDRVEMGCQVTGSPQPRVRWERVGAEMPRNVEYRDNYLILPAVKLDDSGVYRCVASNQAGSVYAQVVLRVTGKVTGSVGSQSTTNLIDEFGLATSVKINGNRILQTMKNDNNLNFCYK